MILVRTLEVAMAKILIVEDDQNLVNMIVDWLEFERHTVEAVGDGNDAMAMLRAYSYDLVILDLTLPGMGGEQVCSEYRSGGGKARILMLTGKGAIEDKEAGFDAGADDYLTKPFHSKELSARVRALLRRSAEVVSETLKAGSLTLNTREFTVTQDGVVLQLAPKEFALLEFFMRHPNQVFSAESLLDRVWQAEGDASIDTVRVCINRLRTKLKADDATACVKTVFGVGYKLETERN